MRIGSKSPFFPRTRWLWVAHNAPNEGDIRTAPEGSTGLGEPEVSVAGSLLRSVRPNPFPAEAVVAYSLPNSGSYRLTIHDVQGREETRKVVLLRGE